MRALAVVGVLPRPFGYNRVISSYKSKKINQNFFVQKMMSDAKLSGVIFTVEQTSGHPVTTINFTTGNKTDLITSGTQNGFSYKYLNNS